MRAVPLELKDANAFVAVHHRHNAPVSRDKWRFGVIDDNGKLIGVLQAAKPVARVLDDGKTIEIVRCCTDGTKNLCSFMLGRARRIAKAMGYSKIISYILETENGASYKAAGWHKEADTRGGRSWNTSSRPRTTAAPTCNKQRWAIIL
jgi:hypothetical protein